MTKNDAEAINEQTVMAAPANIKRVSGHINDALALQIYNAASANETGATNGKVYPSREDEAYKRDVRLWRLHLNSRLDSTTQRAKVFPYANGDGYSFAVQIAPKTKRAAKSEKK